jgi:hypothetical protein
MAILSSLDLRAGRREFPLYASSLRIPVGAAFLAFMVGAGTALYALGNRALAKLRRELEGTPDSPSSK